MMKLLAHAIVSAALMLGGAPFLPAQDDSAIEEQFAREQKEKIDTIKEKLKYFESHVGDWVGLDEYYSVPKDITLSSTDEWKGFFSLDGTHFEMHGTGVSDGEKTTYKWLCTYDTQAEVYRAWYFDSNGNQETFAMDWDDEKKVLVWTSEPDEYDRVSSFFLKVEGNEMKGEGTTTTAGSREPVGKHKMSYKKKRIRI